jgi:hypothetical protein
MFTRIPAMKLVQKAVAATVICGAIALGTGGAAFATTTTSGSTPAATHVKCARAPKALSKITKAEAAITKRITKLQTAESKLTAKGHTKLAARVERRITQLKKVDTKAGNLATRIEAKCPTVSPS